VNGVDFQLTKGSKGNYADYGTSKWARRERALTEDELSAIDTFGLFKLSDFLPQRPTADHYKAIAEMFEASVNGEAYDPERWAQYYKPYGVEAPSGAKLQATTESVQKPVSKPKAAPVVEDIEEDDVPFEVEVPTKSKVSEPVSQSKKSADDILAMIRNRPKQ
jgi:hypothetical protein